MNKRYIPHLTAYLEFPVCGIPIELPVDVEYIHHSDTVDITSARIHAEPVLDRLTAEQIESLKQQVLEHEGVIKECVAPSYHYNRQAYLQQVRREEQQEVMGGDLISRNRRA